MILATLLAIAATISAVVVVLLTVAAVVDWFRSRNQLLDSDRKRIAVTMQEALRTGNYRTVQAIYDTGTETVVDIRKVDSESVDEKLRATHDESELVVWKL